MWMETSTLSTLGHSCLGNHLYLETLLLDNNYLCNSHQLFHHSDNSHYALVKAFLLRRKEYLNHDGVGWHLLRPERHCAMRRAIAAKGSACLVS